MQTTKTKTPRTPFVFETRHQLALPLRSRPTSGECTESTVSVLEDTPEEHLQRALRALSERLVDRDSEGFSTPEHRLQACSNRFAHLVMW